MFNELQHKLVLFLLWSIWLSQVAVVAQTFLAVAAQVVFVLVLLLQQLQTHIP
jgi:hypothetical protein